MCFLLMWSNKMRSTHLLFFELISSFLFYSAQMRSFQTAVQHVVSERQTRSPRCCDLLSVAKRRDVYEEEPADRQIRQTDTVSRLIVCIHHGHLTRRFTVHRSKFQLIRTLLEAKKNGCFRCSRLGRGLPHEQATGKQLWCCNFLLTQAVIPFHH